MMQNSLRFRPVPQPSHPPFSGAPHVFGQYLAEVVVPAGATEPPQIAGWHLRLWPVARLGDGTLEAAPLLADLTPADLRAALARHGYTVLGPLRQRAAP